MVHQITWNEFLIMVLCITAIAYFIVAVFCFRHKLEQWYASWKHAKAERRNAKLQMDDANVLGGIAFPDPIFNFQLNVQRAESADMISAPLTTPEEEPALFFMTENDQPSGVTQLLRDIDILREAANDFSKEECLSMLHVIFQNYKATQETFSIPQVTRHTLNAFADLPSFSLTQIEIDALWSS